jgi:hypothetical protein
MPPTEFKMPPTEFKMPPTEFKKNIILSIDGYTKCLESDYDYVVFKKPYQYIFGDCGYYALKNVNDRVCLVCMERCGKGDGVRNSISLSTTHYFLMTEHDTNHSYYSDKEFDSVIEYIDFMDESGLP